MSLTEDEQRLIEESLHPQTVNWVCGTADDDIAGGCTMTRLFAGYCRLT